MKRAGGLCIWVVGLSLGFRGLGSWGAGFRGLEFRVALNGV